MGPRRALALASVLGLLGLVLSATGLGSVTSAAAAASAPYQLVTRSSGALTGRVFTAMAGDTDGSSVVLYGGQTPGDRTDPIFGGPLAVGGLAAIVLGSIGVIVGRSRRGPVERGVTA
jgi:hypothetical protein